MAGGAGAPADAAAPKTPADRVPVIRSLFEMPGITWLVDTRHNDPRGVFRLDRRSLHISGDGFGYWRTNESFRDFCLRVEFRWGRQVRRPGKALDSGLFIHTQGPDGNSHDGDGAFMGGIEINVFQGATGDILLIRGNDASGRLIAPRLTAAVAAERDAEQWFTWQPAGNALTLSNWGRLNHRGKSPRWMDVEDFHGDNEIEKPRGEWNLLEVESRDKTLRVWLNGIQVNEAHDVWPESGPILFQCEGAEITFRQPDDVG
jgi:3-keto-disaccharide hydrolase